MTSALTRLVRTPEGTATRFGWSFISEFRECPRQWFFHHLRPHPRGSGCAPIVTAYPLALGSTMHAGQDAWYQSNYDLDEAKKAIRLYAYEEPHLGDDENRDKLAGDAGALFTRHHEWFGLEGKKPEAKTNHEIGWEGRVPLLDANGHIMVEREFDCPLGYADFHFTTRLDIVMVNLVTGKWEIWEHKTCDASREPAALREYSLSGQYTGQVWCLQTAWADAIDNLEHPMVNLLIKRAAKDREPRRLVINPRYPEDLEAFRVGVIRTLKRMEANIEEWEHECQRGSDPHDAGMAIFEGEPKGIVCAGAFSAPCAYSPACLAKRYAKGWFADQTRAQVEFV